MAIIGIRQQDNNISPLWIYQKKNSPVTPYEDYSFEVSSWRNCMCNVSISPLYLYRLKEENLIQLLYFIIYHL